MELLKYKTNNYNIVYHDVSYTVPTTIENELYRKHLYKQQILKYLEMCKELKIYENYPNIRHPDILMTNILSYFIFNKKDKDDVYFTKTPDYDINYVMSFLNKFFKSNIDEIKIIFKKILNEMKILSVKNFNELHKFSLNNYNLFNVKLYKKNKSYELKLYTEEQSDIVSLLKKQLAKYTVPVPLYHHLWALWSTQHYSKHDDNNSEYVKPTIPPDGVDKFHKWVYILYTRYSTLSSGSNQASVVPSFKLLLKKKLNIKIELFGSAINTSSTKYGSVFYDIEKNFGSLGSFFDMTIKSGYFEANPPFEFSIIDNMFKKMYNHLMNTDEGLLFFIVLPKMDLYKSTNYVKLKNNSFVKYLNLVDKDKFPYIFYDNKFTHSTFKPIVDTYLIILHNDYIKSAVKENISDFSKYLSEWNMKRSQK